MGLYIYLYDHDLEYADPIYHIIFKRAIDKYTDGYSIYVEVTYNYNGTVYWAISKRWSHQAGVTLMDTSFHHDIGYSSADLAGIFKSLIYKLNSLESVRKYALQYTKARRFIVISSSVKVPRIYLVEKGLTDHYFKLFVSGITDTIETE
jgi:hypothetical protein